MDDYTFHMAIAPPLTELATHPRVVEALRLYRDVMGTCRPGTWDSLQATYSAYRPGEVPPYVSSLASFIAELTAAVCPRSKLSQCLRRRGKVKA